MLINSINTVPNFKVAPPVIVHLGFVHCDIGMIYIYEPCNLFTFWF
jgi:hypothetical protein